MARMASTRLDLFGLGALVAASSSLIPPSYQGPAMSVGTRLFVLVARADEPLAGRDGFVADGDELVALA